ncbi:MAG: RNA-directed DNA polymerase [Candidatus Hydrogenedentes bacterium]|nr:RNA-directed DNA polymerase [Candidatus Hydrogenedentota bacterium]
MRLWGLFKGKGGNLGVEELAKRLGMDVATFRGVRPSYKEFTIPKRSGGTRTISVPSQELKAVQKRILRRLFQRLKAHPTVTGFERGHSIVTNALCHVGKAVVVRMDIKDFFASTSAKRVDAYFRTIGWDSEAAGLLGQLCTHRGGLPQGAPTSPRIANVVNYRMDARLAGLATKQGAAYTRYADDLTFSFENDDATAVRRVVRTAKLILKDEGYEVHHRKKLQVRRRHQRQTVTGLVVNQVASLPRKTRRWLRAVDRHLVTGQTASLTPQQRAGWRAFEAMIEHQRETQS